MLLLDFIINNVFASCLSNLVVNHGSRNQSKEEHVEEDKDDVENVVSL